MTWDLAVIGRTLGPVRPLPDGRTLRPERSPDGLHIVWRLR